MIALAIFFFIYKCTEVENGFTGVVLAEFVHEKSTFYTHIWVTPCTQF